MSKIIGRMSLAICTLFNIVSFSTSETVIAKEPANQKGQYIVQVPHVVLPETIQYAPYAGHQSWPSHDSGISASRSPATYTAFPSYHLPQETEFRVIEQNNYPITPREMAEIRPEEQSSHLVAHVTSDNRIQPTEQRFESLESNGRQPTSALESPFESQPIFSIPQSNAMTAAEPVYLKKIDNEQSPIRQVGATLCENRNDEMTAEEMPETPRESIVFVKRPANADVEKAASVDQSLASVTLDHVFPETEIDLFADWRANRRFQWLQRESFAIRPVAYTEVAPPTQLAMTQAGMGFQQAQTSPAYGQLCQKNYYAGNNLMPYSQQQAGTNCLLSSPPPQNNYQSALGLNSAWNAYFSAAAPQQAMPSQSQRYNSLSQLGTTMPMMSGYGMPMQQPMPGYGGGMQQQTIGYILLYPQASQSGVAMQLAMPNATGQENAQTGDSTSTDAEKANDPNAATQNTQQMQAMFIPASGMANNFAPSYMASQTAQANPMMMGGMNPYMANPMMMGGMNPYMANPMMMGGMNPYMANPMMMGGMNPYMANPMMMGMGGMMPPIIIQMPTSDSAPRRRGLFARRRAAREETPNRYQQASGSLSSLFAQPQYMPAKTAYPYGYFGANASPYQAGSFGGYHDMQMQHIQYPGM